MGAVNRKALSAVQVASAVVPVLTRKMPKKQRMAIWLLTTLAMALITRASRQGDPAPN